MSLLVIPGLNFTEQNLLDKLTQQLEDKNPRNKLRSDYYDSKYLFKDLGISTPPKFRNFEAILGWPAKAVDSLSRRCNLDGFVVPGSTAQDLGIDVMWDDNNMAIEARQAHDSAFIHSCAFVCTIKGDVAGGEPEVLIIVRDAFNATGLWNPRKRGFTAGLTIVERDDTASVMHGILYLPDQVVTFKRAVVGGAWMITRRTHTLGRVPMEPLVYRPRLGRPFGRSRISRPVMYLTDAAVRTTVRSEIGAEFFTAPQRYGLNLPEEAFVGGGWTAITGRFLNVEPPGLDDDVDPNFKPEVGQFPQMSMQPHGEQLRQWAMLFCAETSLHASQLGIVQDNPSSAEAINLSDNPLVQDAEVANEGFGVGWSRAIRNALMIRDNRSVLPDAWRGIEPNWRDPKITTQAARADAMAKQIAVMPWLAETEVALEAFGYTRTQIERLMAEKRRATMNTLVQQLSRPNGGVGAGETVPPEPSQPAG